MGRPRATPTKNQKEDKLMKLGVFTTLLSQKPLDEVLEFLRGLGVQAVEIGCGG